MINAIELKTTATESYVNEYGNKLIFLPNIRHINIFVGENNSGKSRLMRALVNSKDAAFLTDELTKSGEKSVNSERNNLKSWLERVHATYPDIVAHELHDEMTAPELYVYYKTYFEGKKLSELKFNYPNQNASNEIQNILNRLHQDITTKSERKSNHTLSSCSKVYIPILRGIENFNNYFEIRKNASLDSISMTTDQRNALNEYKSNTKKIYSNKINSVYKIDPKVTFTGENLYDEIRNKLLGEEQGRNFIRDFENFISVNFYDGEGFNIIPLINQGFLNVKIGNNQERPLHDLGDGIKQLICILYKVYELKDSEAFFFIEEPEINLHPGYQRKLIDILQQEEFSKLYFFITTHSNHFVDRYFDGENMSIYKFVNVDKKNNQFQVINTPPYDIDLLNLLGVNNSSVFMANATIWVEGLSDKIYLEKYLQIYIRDNHLNLLKEGVDYSFVEYGGNNVTHWSFDDMDSNELFRASGITNRSMLIADNDDNAKRKERRKENLRAVFGDNFIELPVREIENTISKTVLEKTIFPDTCPVYKNGMEDKRDSFNTKSAHIWKYIDEHYEFKSGKKYWNSYSKSPRVNKILFARKICRNVNTIDDLTVQAKQLCEMIYTFLMKTYKEINE